jgi:hypothetical protein
MKKGQNTIMRVLGRVLLAGVLTAGLAAVGLAERTRFWRQTNFDEFDKGTAKGVALRSDGRLVLAPRFAQFADPNAAYLWTLRVDSKGRLYAAGGSNAKVLRLDDKGASAAVFESQEMAAQALTFDAQDNLYVGTSPDGKVYKVTADGKSSVFFEAKTKYIWDLAFDSAGTLYVATGDKGEVFAVGKDGKGQAYYKSEEAHVRTLAFDAKGNLILGTDPNGLIVRVEKSAQGTRGFVLYETAKREVTSLLAARDGSLYASAIGEKARGPAQPQPVIVQPPPPPPQQAQQPGAPPQAQQPVTTFAPFPTTTGGSDVLRISPDGAPEQLWSSREDLVYSLALSPKGRLLMGTGNKGLVLQLEENNVFSSLGKTSSAQVTGLVQGPGGKVFAATSNPGKIFALGPDTEPEGTFESQTFDARVFSQWGRLRWWGEDGAANGQVAFYVRTGNTSNPEKNWSAWCGPYSNPKGEAVSCPPARFAQWKAVFKAGAGGAPSIGWVSMAYLPKNVAPTIDGIALQNPGIRIQSFAAPQGAQQQQPVQLRMPPPTMGIPGGAPPQVQPQRFDPPPQGFAQRGYQAVVWAARDDNDDDLLYSVYFRAEGEKNWRLLKDKLETKFYSWDTNTMPDGAYYLRIVASDADSNPPGEGLTAERVSDRFEVDNTAPDILTVRHGAGNPEVRVQFTAKDSYSIITRAEFTVNSGPWQLVFPTDRTSDSAEETYEIVVRDLPPGEHTITVRVYDQFENSATEKVTFTLPAPRR